MSRRELLYSLSKANKVFSQPQSATVILLIVLILLLIKIWVYRWYQHFKIKLESLQMFSDLIYLEVQGGDITYVLCIFSFKCALHFCHAFLFDGELFQWSLLTPCCVLYSYPGISCTTELLTDRLPYLTCGVAMVDSAHILKRPLTCCLLWVVQSHPFMHLLCLLWISARV